MGVLNCENTLDESLESVAAQTETRWECILCDDGSTDRTADVIRRWQERFPDRIIFLQNEKNTGLAPALNRCLAAARGEFIARMDGDDRCSPDRYSRDRYCRGHYYPDRFSPDPSRPGLSSPDPPRKMSCLW